MKYPNVVEFKVSGRNALFTDPITKVGGEKMTYLIPTYEALKGVLSSVYWKPTFIWYIDKVRVMNQFRTETIGVRPLKIHGGNDLANYTYLVNPEYQVMAHFEWNENRPELAGDRNEHKHFLIANRMIEKGGRRDVFLGARECQAYVEPCKFGEGVGFYDDLAQFDFGLMYHGITYADEAYSEETKGMETARFWNPVMKNGVITFARPQDISLEMCKPVHEMEIKPFGEGNFTGLEEFRTIEGSDM